ncbi:hypothetical protein C8R43DRAFT_81383 [Mycena crocata]|nr:hypothetical protein C8R43DRAFT_81383 [Mycena crocata]
MLGLEVVHLWAGCVLATSSDGLNSLVRVGPMTFSAPSSRVLLESLPPFQTTLYSHPALSPRCTCCTGQIRRRDGPRRERDTSRTLLRASVSRQKSSLPLQCVSLMHLFLRCAGTWILRYVFALEGISIFCTARHRAARMMNALVRG